jgi:hypothetical protein
MSERQLDFDRDIARFTPLQMKAIRHLDSGCCKFLLFGGCLGPGKSYLLRWYGLRRLIALAGLGHRNCAAMLACEDYPTLKDRQLVKIAKEFPPELGTLYQDHKDYGRCFVLNAEYGSGVLCFRNLDDPSKYASSEWALILVDELTKNTFDVFTHLRTRLRWPGLSDLECQFVAGSNPGGHGHSWVKQLWMDRKFPAEWLSPSDYSKYFVYVPARATDNPHLDAAYWQMLDTLPDNLRAAFRDGSWDIFIGQAFPEISRETHAIQPIWPVPEHSPLYMTMDWGFGAPFSIGWWWTDEEGRAIRCNRWYGASGPNQGLRLTDSEIAEGIIDREIEMGWARMASPGDYRSVQWSRQVIRYAGFDCFNKKPDYKGGGQGPTTAETFTAYGLYLSPMDASRHIKIRQFRERLRVREDGWPMLLVYETDDEFFRIMPTLALDKNNIEDVDRNGECHIFDEACHICMARPLHAQEPEKPKTGPQKIIEMVEKGPQDDSMGLPIGMVPEFDDDGGFFGGGEW